ncbi:Non-specific lipid-transfer protein 6 [Cardamine amara subsp. amara]|uniref:Non-specific lipid-transfer protein n=1 Tax=Cardamine amara subsp. amara TaxID=228776 RepID=A0ABD0ZGK5_CARAN
MKSLLLAVCLILALHCGEAAVTCETVAEDLYPCISYVAQGGSVPDTCCTGIRTLNSQAQTTEDRQSICRCIKSAMGGAPLDSINNALSLPAKCGVNLPFNPSPSTNCDSIN